jgi:hypothetical protein
MTSPQVSVISSTDSKQDRNPLQSVSRLDIQEIPDLYTNGMFVRDHNSTPSWAKWIQYTPSYITFKIRFSYILHPQLVLSSGLFKSIRKKLANVSFHIPSNTLFTNNPPPPSLWLIP